MVGFPSCARGNHAQGTGAAGTALPPCDRRGHPGPESSRLARAELAVELTSPSLLSELGGASIQRVTSAVDISGNDRGYRANAAKPNPTLAVACASLSLLFGKPEGFSLALLGNDP